METATVRTVHPNVLMRRKIWKRSGLKRMKFENGKPVLNYAECRLIQILEDENNKILERVEQLVASLPRESR